MTAFFNDIQWMSLICSDSSRMTFTTLSVISVILSILVRLKNQGHRPIHSLYHYTSYDRMFQILRSGCMKGGHHGVVFTTVNKRYQNRGTVRPRVFSKKKQLKEIFAPELSSGGRRYVYSETLQLLP